MSGKSLPAFGIGYIVDDTELEMLKGPIGVYQSKSLGIDPLAAMAGNVEIPPGAFSGPVNNPLEKLYWLLYTTNQIADFFSSDRYNGDSKDFEGWVQSDILHMQGTIRDYSYLRGIRSIAGLYEMFEQTVRQPILNVEIKAITQLNDCDDISDDIDCDFYSEVSFFDMDRKLLQSGQNEAYETKAEVQTHWVNWNWGYAVGNSNQPDEKIIIEIKIWDEDNSKDDGLVDIVAGPIKSLILTVDLNRCAAGLESSFDVYYGNFPGRDNPQCGVEYDTKPDGTYEADQGVASVRFKITMNDVAPPEISCDAADGDWHDGDVDIACSAVDYGVGLENPADAVFFLTTTGVLVGTETDDALTNTKVVCDIDHRCVTAGPIGGNKIDKKAPEITILEPTARQYSRSEILNLDYSVTDNGSGVETVTAMIDGSETVAGSNLSSGDKIDLLTTLSLGEHAFVVHAVDGTGNATFSEAVNFTIFVTPQSIIDAVNLFTGSGAIYRTAVTRSLLAMLRNAQERSARGQCKEAERSYDKFINQVRAQSGKSIVSTAAGILIENAQYLISNCAK